MTGPGDPLFAATLALRGWFPWWAALLLGVVAVAAVGVLYYREGGRTSVTVATCSVQTPSHARNCVGPLGTNSRSIASAKASVKR